MKDYFIKQHMSFLAMFVVILVIFFCGHYIEKNESEVVYEQEETVHEHNWVYGEYSIAKLVETTELQSVASEGIPKVYLTRTRSNYMSDFSDVYLAYDKEFQDISIQKKSNNEFEIEYISNGIPRMEKHSEATMMCQGCGEYSKYEGYFYKFYIPEGTYLICY